MAHDPAAAAHEERAGPRRTIRAPSLPELYRRQRRLLWRRVRRTSLVLVVVGVLVALVPVAMALNVRHVARTPAAPRPTQIQPAQDGLHCAQDVAWDRVGQRIAVLGYSRSCPLVATIGAISDDGGLLYVYSASGGAPTTQIQLDNQVGPALKSQHMGGPLAVIYLHAQFSPDGRFVAVFFLVEDTSAQYTPPLFAPLQVAEGMLYEDLQYGNSDTEIVTTSSSVTTIWQAFSFQPTLGVNALPPSLSYRWSSDGSLIPETPLTGGASQAIAGSPVGNPALDSTFTIWQPGVVTRYSGGVYVWQTNFIASNPNGHSIGIAAPIDVKMRVQPSGEATAATPTAGLPADVSGMALGPVRDAAMHAVYASMRPDGATNPQQIDLAWRPDGRRLATTPDARRSVSTVDPTVTVYDCASGQALARLTPPHTAPSQQDEGLSFLRWSPDGTMLLAHDETSGTITIWRGTMLPA